MQMAAATPLALSGLIVAFAVSWLLLAQVNFSYGFWHDHAGIGAAIDKFGPTNLYRQGFHLTSREQRIELFAGINRSVHRGGEGLEELSYTVPGYPTQTLLREPEIIHLQDVADLINQAIYLVALASAVWLGLLLYYGVCRKPLPSLKTQMIGMSALIALVGALVLVIGPVKVFYALHIWLFPEDHQWFFYYQESLMSTMMMAPNLFGWIALEWLLLAVICFVVSQYLFTKVLNRR